MKILSQALAFPVILFLAPLVGCSSAPAPIPESIVAEIRAMADDDQTWERRAIDGDPSARSPSFFGEKAALQVERARRCREIFDQFGLPSPERVGAEAASGFWVLVQHADENVGLQRDVLAAMDLLEPGAYDAQERAYLVDRVRCNSGMGQLYGTQMDFDNSTGRAFPKPIEGPGEVDVRRAEAGMEPLVDYVNGVCEMHFLSNRAAYEGVGVTKAYVYPGDFSDW